MSLQTFFENFALLADAPNGAAKLRELILQLAVEGKLVAQDHNHEPASTLLERLGRERTKLIEEKNIRRMAEDSPAVNQSEELYVLPDNWRWCKISDFAIVRGGKRLPQGAAFSVNPTPYIYIQVTNMKNGTIIKDALKYIDESIFQQIKQYTIDKDDIYITIAGTIGQSGVVPDFFHGMNLTENAAKLMFRGLNKKYLLIALQSEALQRQFAEKTNQMAQPKLALKRIADALFPLPPLEEQKRVVAKVDELMRLCDELESRQQARRESRVRLNNATLAPLNNVASLAPEEFEQASARLADIFARLYDSAETVSRLRSTILQLAVQGKLAQQNAKDEPASKLLKRVKHEKSRLLEEGKLKKSKEALAINIDKPFPIPINWEWTYFDEIRTYAFTGLERSQQQQSESNKLAYLKMNNITLDGRCDLTSFTRVNASDEEISKFKLSEGDFLFNTRNSYELVGKTCVFPSVQEQFLFNNNILKIKFAASINPYFINLWFVSPYGRAILDTLKSSTTNVAAIYQGKLAGFPLPLPPLEEQKRIVAKVNQLMALCDELETKLRQAEADSEKLMKAAVRYVLTAISQNTRDEALSVIA